MDVDTLAAAFREAQEIRTEREELDKTQLQLSSATHGKVPRWKISHAEAGYRPLTPGEVRALRAALRKFAAARARRQAKREEVHAEAVVNNEVAVGA
jgi:hypothetical protein